MKVQVMLNHFIGNNLLSGYKPLGLDGHCGPKTKEAISAFQFQNGLISEEHFQGQIRPDGATTSFMNQKAGGGRKDQKGTRNCWAPCGVSKRAFSVLRRFFIRGLEREPINDSYLTFTYYDVCLPLGPFCLLGRAW